LPKTKAEVNKKANRALPVVFFTIFLDVLGIGILIPVIPLLLAAPMSPEYLLPAGWSFTQGLILLGWLTAIYPLMQFFATPILGQLSDRYGRKRVLAISLVGTALGYVLFAIGIITKNIPLLFAARALDGITGGNISVAQAVVSDITAPKDRTKRFGMIGATFGIGFVLGPYIGAKLASPNVNFYGLFDTPSWFAAATPFWFAAILSAINVVLVLAFLPETNLVLKRVKIKLTQSIANITKAVTYPGLRVIFPSTFLYFAGFTFFTTFFQVFLINKLGFNQSNIGDYFAYVGIWIAIAQVTVTPFVAKRLKNYQVIRFSLAATGAALLTMLFAGNTKELLLFTPLFAVFNGLTMANVLSLVSKSAGKEVQGEVLGINASVQALAQAIPAVISGYVATMGVSVPVITGAGIMIISGVVFWVLYRPSQQVLHEDAEPTASY